VSTSRSRFRRALCAGSPTVDVCWPGSLGARTVQVGERADRGSTPPERQCRTALVHRSRPALCRAPHGVMQAPRERRAWRALTIRIIYHPIGCFQMLILAELPAARSRDTGAPKWAAALLTGNSRASSSRPGTTRPGPQKEEFGSLKRCVFTGEKRDASRLREGTMVCRRALRRRRHFPLKTRFARR
jgi:hypothetical protein